MLVAAQRERERERIMVEGIALFLPNNPFPKGPAMLDSQH